MWIEICLQYPFRCLSPSQPAKAVWIEISMDLSHNFEIIVTACEGCVD
ncbi:hypothetical protein CLOSTASPAR_02513 [[Clostridium] asparagiforme DSM 15981]|uniref:Uncharacterized protein n=1 Tax=[Clostridium] asparagiforme DSM 15981 TaxID=518636 RepID=C0CZT6_9FIRM|nr:hypothetical protein CLOSTASPAR_02513 [[Clostridium] asparagiforme DSM 15981]